VLYPLGVGLPIMKIERLGHEHVTNIWNGVAELFAEGEWIVAAVVLICSIVAPIAKLTSMVALSVPRVGLSPHHRAAIYRLVEWIGRWGMVDVLLVALLVAFVKLGSWVEVTPGPGLVAFAAVVVLSLLSTAFFDPHAIWEQDP
jgi:paraquat-inducible protein A